MAELTSGTSAVDHLVDGVRIGDNLVVQGDPGTPLELLADRFVAAVDGNVPVVRVRTARAWDGEVPAGTTLLDWSAVRTGRPASVPGALPAEATLTDALAMLRAADEEVGRGAAFVFDGLADVQAAWGADAALELFLDTCPRLYRRRSLAFWPVDASAHKPAFLRRLAEITQVVVEVTPEGDGLRLTVREADGRPDGVIGRTVVAEVADGDLRVLGEPTTARRRLGGVLREQRLARGLAQAEVARRVGITPSALSQVERGVRGPSGDTLVRLWEVLDVPFGPATGAGSGGYRVARRSGRERLTSQPGLSAERLVDDEQAGQVWLVEVAPGATGDRPPIAVKGAEVATVLRGVLDVSLDGHRETLSEGDALVITDAVVVGWANPGIGPTEVLWTVATRSR